MVEREQERRNQYSPGFGFCPGIYAQLSHSDGMRRPVSERDAIRSQVIDALEAPRDKETSMKKTSTAATASDKNLHRKLTIGLDLGDRSSWYCMLDEAGEVIGEQKLGTTPRAMKEVFAEV